MNSILYYRPNGGANIGDTNNGGANNGDVSNGHSTKGCCTVYKKVLKNGAQLSPYDDADKSTKLSAVETCCFFTNYVIVFVLFFCSFISVVYADSVYNQDDCWIHALNFVRIVLHLSSQFCAIQICFIFSKIVYNVPTKLNKLAEQMDNQA